MPGPADFAAVDTGDIHDLVAMMDATDAWPAVAAARDWILEQAALDDDAIVVDAGCGPGTFGALANGCPVDADWSRVMLEETRRRRPDARILATDLARLALRDDAAQLVHAERVLQWSADAHAALAELRRVVAPGGHLAVTDSDWATLVVEHTDAEITARIATAALSWVPHARLAPALPSMLHALGVHDVRARRDTVEIDSWDPDDPAQHDGPPGLPLHSIAPADRDAVDAVARRARAGRFRARLTLVTCLAKV